MTRGPGYVIIKSSTPQAVAKEAATSVLESPLIQKHEKYTEHEVPNICVKMKDDFMKVSREKPRNIEVLTLSQGGRP
jgi:hypothetical protein